MHKHKHLILTVIILTVACILPMHGVFADDTTVVATVKDQSIGLQAINMLVKLASWGWAIIAIVAGKLMSNDFIYAPGLKIDESLYTMRNYMKNFANFTIGFIFVYYIIRSLVAKDAFAIKKELPKFLIASILANMSWFIMGTLLDVANVATAAVGSFPQIIISEDSALKEKMQKLNVGIPDKLCLDMTEGDAKKCTGTYDVKRDIDKIRARMNDMSGPLLFIGASIYRFQDYDLLNVDITDPKSFLTGTILKLIMILMYIAPLLALLVVNIKRVFYMWLWIIFSPLIVVFEMLGVKPKGKFVENIFSVKEVIGMVFMPVFVIGGVAIMLILSVSMYSVMGGKGGIATNPQITSQVLGSAEISSAPGSSTFYNTAAGTEITYVGDVFRDIAGYAGGLVGYLIITSFVIMLLWSVVKMSTSSSKIAGETFKNILDLTKNLAGSMNIIPMGGSFTSLGAMGKSADIFDKEKGLIGAPLEKRRGDSADEGKDLLYDKFYNQSGGGKFLQKVYGNSMKYVGDPEDDISDKQKREIDKISNKANTIDNFTENLYRLLGESKKKKILTLNSTGFIDYLSSTLNNNTNLKNDIAKQLDIDVSKVTKDELFSGNSEYSKKFLNYLENNLRGVKTKLANSSTTPIPSKDKFILYSNNASQEDKNTK